jgi:two-component system nitrogen regulation sensor histidine kinase NtrY
MGEREGRLERVARFVRDGGEEPRRENLRWHDEEGENREWTLTWVPLPGTEDPAALLVVDDVTEVVRGQRLEAWAEMARIIAHEIKNPLTPIQLSTEHMRQVYAHDRDRFDLVLERCTDNILRQVEELRDIASEFSIYSRIPKAELSPADLVAAMEELADAYRHAGEARIDLVADVGELRARFDKKLLGRAIRNLLENALRATDGRGRVELRVERAGGRAVIRVADSGPGVDPSMLRRIFEPYFSTYDSGTGLGLAITRRIVEEHGGEIEAHNREGGGLEVVATLPLTDETGVPGE